MYLVRFGEIFTKGKNRDKFLETLKDNIKRITGCKEFVNLRTCYLIDTCKNLDKIPGIVSYSEVLICDFNEINQTALKLINNEKTFRVRANRSTKVYKTSNEIEKELGEFIIKNTNLKVDLFKPELTIYVSIIKNRAYLYKKKIKCLGGLPIGCEAEVLIKVNNEKLSTVAGFLMLKRGCTIALTKDLPLLKKYYDYKIKEDHKVIATDETLNNLQLETTNKFILRPLIGFTEEEINEIYNKINK